MEAQSWEHLVSFGMSAALCRAQRVSEKQKLPRWHPNVSVQVSVSSRKTRYVEASCRATWDFRCLMKSDSGPQC